MIDDHSKWAFPMGHNGYKLDTDMGRPQLVGGEGGVLVVYVTDISDSF